jgi:hypothetical protein
VRHRLALFLAWTLLFVGPVGGALAGDRARVNPAWLEVLDLASGVRQSPQASPAELVELQKRMAPLSDEQRRLIAEAAWLDAEHDWLVEANRRIVSEKAEFERTCSVITDDEQLAGCQGVVDRINRQVDAYNDRTLSFLPRDERYSREVRAWLTSLGEMTTWMRPILSRRAPTPEERVLLERERERLRTEVDGLQEALRRLESAHEVTEADRADWERRYEGAVTRASERLRDYLADQALQVAQEMLERCSERLTAKIRAKIDERINAKGSDAPDREDLVRALDAEIAALAKDRAEVDSAVPALGRAWAAVKNGAAALESASWEDRRKALETMSNLVGDLLGDPAVQRALRIGEVPATVYTYGKLISDASFDIATELLSIRRIGQMDRAAEEYLAAVTRLDEQMKKKVGRIAEINRRLP